MSDVYDDKMAEKWKNEPKPDNCPKCKGELEEGKGMVGETVLYCPNIECKQGLVWENSEEAFRIVF